jgi:putrescine transport system substrate-binding protein
MLRTLAAAALLAVSATATAESVVNVYNWSDYITDEARDSFTKATGTKVRYDVYDSNEVLAAKLLAGHSGYDVVFPSARPFAQRQVAAGIYLPLDKSKLPNWKHLYPDLLAGLKDVDPGNRYLVPYMWGTTGIGLNVEKVRAALGKDAALDSWALLFDPAKAAKLASCGIAVLDDETEGLGAAFLYLGKPVNAGGKADLDAAIALYAKVRPYIRYFHSSRYIEDLANGEICLAVGYSGDVLQAKSRAEEAGKPVEIQYVIPKEGAIRWVDLAGIPKDAPNPDAAHAFINHLMEPGVIAGISEFVGYANANQSATPLLGELKDNPGIYPPAEVMARLADDTTPKQTEVRARVRAWTRIRTGK